MSDSKRIRRHFMEDGGKGKENSKNKSVKKKRFVKEERSEYDSWERDWKRGIEDWANNK